MEDMISRKAAIEAMGKAEWAKERLRELPSAQPEERTEKRTETHACDCISRQAVIEINQSYHGQMPNEVNHRIWKEINELPSAQPEHTNCTYCHEDFDGYVYPIEKNCHAWISRERLIMSAKGWKKEIKINYCPMCGRRLGDG